MPRRSIPCAGTCGGTVQVGPGSLTAGEAMCRKCRGRKPKPEPQPIPSLLPCTGCDAVFAPVRATQTYCSGSCRERAKSRRYYERNGWYRTAPRSCEMCSAEYQPTYPEQRTCGRDCGTMLRKHVTHTMSVEPAKKPEPVPKQCRVCGQSFLGTRRVTCGSEDCQAQWAAGQAERSRIYMNANYQRYKDRIVQESHRRRSQLKEQWVEDVSLAVLYVRDKGRCFCGGKVPPLGTTAKRDPLMASIDHLVPLSQLGEHSYANTRLAHYRCNLRRGNRGGGEQLALVG